MKINFGKLAGVVAQLAVAVPVVVAAVKPVIAAARKSGQNTNAGSATRQS